MKSFLFGLSALILCASKPTAFGQVSAEPTPEQRSEWHMDVVQAISIIGGLYAYPLPEWDLEQLEKNYTEILHLVASEQEFFRIVERLIDELHDHHAHLGSNQAS